MPEAARAARKRGADMDHVFEYPGIPLTMQRITPGNTLTQIAAGVYEYKEYTIGYDSGDYAFAEGDVIVGATSAAIGIVISCTVASGTVGAGSAAGNIRFHSWNGINFTDDEKIKVAADTDVGDINGSVPVPCADDYLYKGQLARSVLVVAETQSQRVSFSAKKIIPDQTSAYGIPVAANSSIQVKDINAIKNIMVVDATASSAGSSILIGYF
jgi:hypothetical protein